MGGWSLSPFRSATDARATTVAAPGAPTANGDEELVYLDSNGYIRAVDPTPPTDGSPTVQWVSPTGGWRDVALGDFNNDGDLEIVAVGGEAYTGRLAIYDPVMVDGPVNSDQIINNVPWTLLYERSLPGQPLVVAAGELNRAIPGPEIAFVFALNPEDRPDSEDLTQLSLLQAVPPTLGGLPDGSQWTPAAVDVEFRNVWQTLAIGDLDNQAVDELVLVDGEAGVVRVYRLTAEVDEADEDVVRIVPQLIYENASGDRPWKDATVAHFVPGVLAQMALARASGPGGNTLWVLYYDPSTETGFGDSYAELFLPAPHTIFAGDIDNNGDDELFLLRDVPTNIGSRPHLIMRNYDNANSPLPPFELTLDADNGYQAGVAGDTDGDGRDEVIIMRNSNIRVYLTPESNATSFTDFATAATTDQQTIVIGNLDGNGVFKLPQLSVFPTQFTAITLYAGMQRAETLRLATSSAGAAGAIPFAITIADNPDWLRLSRQSGATEQTLTVTFDATALTGGDYATTLTVTSRDPTVANTPLTIPVRMTVLPGLAPTTSSVTVFASCAADAPSVQRNVALDGPAGLIFSAVIEDANQTTVRSAQAASGVIWPSAVDWVSASSPNVLPTALTLTFSPANLATATTDATLRLEFYDSQGRQQRTVALQLSCAEHQRYLPLIRR
jgi:hypothetical protein